MGDENVKFNEFCNTSYPSNDRSRYPTSFGNNSTGYNENKDTALRQVTTPNALKVKIEGSIMDPRTISNTIEEKPVFSEGTRTKNSVQQQEALDSRFNCDQCSYEATQK